ncbi:hypothetical protein [Burkholderia vietnamiensis]|uniref:hypothetical protein n=1 Tax=Burkholderia vietnamiensis TaxID=60552 RepID=UPI00158D7815|nr:hypothetical protein [Burkholderia vietnamiensis]
MNPSQVARILHEVARAQGERGLLQWEFESPYYRERVSRFVGQVLDGKIAPDRCFNGDAVRQAVVTACMAPVLDAPEAGDEQGYKEREKLREKAERGVDRGRNPGECVSVDPAAYAPA